MAGKMRPIAWLAAAAASLALAWVGWNAWHLLPEAWARYSEGTPSGRASLDSALFDRDLPQDGLDSNAVAADTGLAALLDRQAPRLRTSRIRRGAVRTPDGDLPLYTLVLHQGRPLVEAASLLVDSLRTAGYAISGSDENPRGKYPWLCRLSRDGRVQALLRARLDSTALPGSYALELVLWADSLEADQLASLATLPRGAVLALPPAALAEPRLRQEAARSGLTLAVLARLETARYAVQRQEARRLLLHHGESEVARRLDFDEEPTPAPAGLVVLEGERGAADPGLAHSVAAFAARRGLWLLDATAAPGSRLRDEANRSGAARLDGPRRVEGDPRSALAAAAHLATLSGRAGLLLPLDDSTLHALPGFLPLCAREGVSVQPVRPIQGRHAIGD